MRISKADYMAYLIEQAGWAVSWGSACVAVEDEIKEVGEAIGRALREQGGQVDEPIAQPKVTPYGGDWPVLY